MIKKLKRLEYLLEQINDEELKLLIIDTFMELVEDLPEEIIDLLRNELNEEGFDPTELPYLQE